MGFSINTLTLFGIILATGIVVDDAIVVIENIERHIQEYKKSARAGGVGRDARGASARSSRPALVLIAVFVPVAFFPGTTGRLYAQFSMTIAFAVALSAFNAVTLTPALSALLLERESHQQGTVLLVLRARSSPAGTHGLRASAALRHALRGGPWSLLFVVGARADVVGLSQRCRRRSCPKRTRATSSSRCRRRRARRSNTPATIARQAEQIILKDPDVLALFSVMGFSFSGAAPNQGLMFVAPEAVRRPNGSRAFGCRPCSARVSGPLFGIPGAIVVGFAPPSIPGLEPVRRLRVPGARSERARDINALAAATQAMVGAGQRSRRSCAGLFSPFTANDPQLQVTIDRERALALGLPLSEITSAMQIFLGSQYVNDFEFNNRAYRVYVQADQQFRSNPQALKQLYARTTRRRDGAARAGRAHQGDDGAAGHQPLQPVPLGDDQRIGGARASARARRCRRWSGWPRRTCPTGMGYAWSGISLEETKAGRQSFLIFGLGAAARLPDAGGAVRKPGAAVHRAAGRSARGARRARRAVGRAASPTTSTARSGWSCWSGWRRRTPS